MNQELFDRIKAALAGRYTIVGEVGRGGMATVYKADDLRHSRQVAIKVLMPELAAAIGPDRFLREIDLVARLTHPHILPLLESGQADGLTYYVMPFVDGETLRMRLQREHMLPLEEALDLIRQVAGALAFAHSRGIVHRDVKPENILLSGNQAVVADFGVAKTVGDIGGPQLTEIGFAIGTASYMSPEQAIGSPNIDGRSDQYSLACVVYEMLAGQPPFTGRDSRAIVARHTLDPVPPLRTLRETVAVGAENAVVRALSKLAVDRFPTVTAFVEALEVGTTQPIPVASEQVARPEPEPPPSRRRVFVEFAAVAAVAILVLWAVFRGPTPTPVDEQAVAILPFRLAGQVDTTLLAPAPMVELIRTKFASSSSLRTTDPVVTLNAWRAASRGRELESDRRMAELGRRLGAGQVLVGTVVGTPTSLSFTARLLSTTTGAATAQVDGLSGPPESVLNLLDQLVARLLLGTAGERGMRLEDLATENLEALRAYLSGVESYERGQYQEATSSFGRAIEIDSTFALAGLGLTSAGALTEHRTMSVHGIEVAWANRQRLNPADQLWLRGLAGARYPDLSTSRQDLRVWEQIVESNPDRWEAWYQLGDMLFHYGAAVGRTDTRRLAANDFRRALAHDSTLAPALEHLIEISASEGDSAELRHLSQRYLATDSLGDHADFVRWRVGVAFRDTSMRAPVIQRLPNASTMLLKRIALTAQLEGVGLNDARLAVDELRRRAHTQLEQWEAASLARDLVINLGRPDEAPPALPRGLLAFPFDELAQVVYALYWDGDDTAAAAAVVRRRLSANLPFRAGLSARESPQLMDYCLVGLWDMGKGKIDSATRLAALLGQARDAGQYVGTSYVPLCKATLDAQIAAATKAPDLAAKTERLDSLLGEHPLTNPYVLLAGNLTAASLLEASGDTQGALTAVRRRPYLYDGAGVAGLSTLLREEGRLAALVGDRDGAVRAYQHYLRLRRDPEPRLSAEVAEVRRALGALSADQPQSR